MKRRSAIFLNVVEAARDALLAGHKSSTAFRHRGIRGDERAALVADFLRARIPSLFKVAKGEAIDSFDRRTGQLDMIVYDDHSTRPVSQQAENVLVPCEATYAVIEVKSRLSRAELRKCVKAAKSLKQLRPFGHKFVLRREPFENSMDPKAHRILYLIFAYSSDLRKNDWVKREFARVTDVAKSERIDPGVIDRIFVMDRGLINVARPGGKAVGEEPAALLAELFLHIVDFIQREHGRRPPIDWHLYASPKTKGWRSIRLAGKEKAQNAEDSTSKGSAT